MYSRDEFFYVNYKDIQAKYRPYFRKLFDAVDYDEKQLKDMDTFDLVSKQIDEERVHHIYQKVNAFFMFKDQYDVIEHRYLRRNKIGEVVETPWEMCDRVATFISLAEPKDRSSSMDKLNKWYPIYLSMLLSFKVCPNTPTWASAGIPGFGSFACSVVGNGDSMEEISKWYNSVLYMNKYGFGIGHSLHKFRPSGAPFAGSKTTTKSPLKWLNVIQEMSVGMSQGDSGRGGANLVSMPVWHPSILEFIGYKTHPEGIDMGFKPLMKSVMNCDLDIGTKEILIDILDKSVPLRNFNMSVLVNDDFMHAVEEDKDWLLKFELPDHAWKQEITVKASKLWDRIVTNAFETGDPGLLFFNRINKDNHLMNIKGPIWATNPCITGDTLIATADGRNAVPIKQLAEEGLDIPVYCLDNNQNPVIRTMRHPRLTGKDQQIYKVNLDDGNSIRCTGNHKFILKDGTTKDAKDLQHGDSLERFDSVIENRYRRIATSQTREHNYHPELRQYNMIADFYHGVKPKGHVTHHKNFDSYNDSPENLEYWENEIHKEFHAERMF